MKDKEARVLRPQGRRESDPTEQQQQWVRGALSPMSDPTDRNMGGRMLILPNFVFQEDVSQFLSFTDFQTSRPRTAGVIIQGLRVTAGLQGSHKTQERPQKSL